MLRDYHRGFGGYVIRSGEHSIYHAGDTAYFGGFREIGNRLRPPRSAAADRCIQTGFVPQRPYQS